MTNRPWLVAPHEPLETIAENVWSIEGVFPERPMIRRRMQIVRRSDGALVFHNAVPVNDEALEQLRAKGRPAVLLVPAPSHMLDIAPFAEKLGLDVYCPAEIRALVEQKVAVKGDYGALPKDPTLVAHVLGGTSSGEAIFEARSPDGRGHLVVCDAVLNLAHLGGFGGFFMRYIGRATGGPRVGPFFKWRHVKDREALRQSLRRLAALPNLATLLPSHGAIIRGDVAAALEEAASRL